MENPEFYQGGYYNSPFTQDKSEPAIDAKNADNFIEDLLNLPNDDGMLVAADDIVDNTVTTTDSSSTANTVIDTSSNSSSFSAATTATHEPHYSNFQGEEYIGGQNLSSSDPQFSSELCVPVINSNHASPKKNYEYIYIYIYVYVWFLAFFSVNLNT